MSQKFNYDKDKNEFTKEMVNDTIKYQKHYNFDIGENNNAHNNESDAFRHTYMQSVMANRYGILPAKSVSFGHELIGKIKGQDPREYNMDMWNNQQGQQIYNEIRREYPNFGKLSEEQRKDIIAGKVVQRMREDKLITGLDDPRKFEKQKPSFTPMPWIGGVQNNGKPLGFAADIDINQLAQQLGLQFFNTEIPQQVQPQQNSGFYGYINPLTGSNHIYTREEVGSMSLDEFAQHEKEIDAQTRAFNGTMPTNGDLQQEAMIGGGVVYVNSYTRSDGTEVKGYYRSKPRF
ncbi:hypothetical protein IJ818_06760, partial [bacterium]|nr:hypothetical protein [bacterium]